MTKVLRLRWLVALPVVVAVVTGCGASVSIGKPDELSGATIAKKANAQLEKQNPQIVHGQLTCKKVKYTKGATTRCLRTADLDQGRRVMIGATVTITDTTKGGHYTIAVDKQVQEFGEVGTSIEQDLATQYAKQFRTGKPKVTCPEYLKGEVGASVTCQLEADSGKIDLVVTVSKVDPTNYLTIYTFKQA
jgi:hypothetical protein